MMANPSFDRNEWRPRCGLMQIILSLLLLAALVGLVFGLSLKAYAQGAPLEPPNGLDARSILHTLIPVLWASMGPLVMAALTKGVNQVSGRYVPRSLQVILSGLLGAIGAGFADGGATVAATAIAGGATQVYAGVAPETLRTSSTPPAAPGA